MQVKLAASIVFLDKYIATIVVIVIFTRSTYILIGNNTSNSLDDLSIIFYLMLILNFFF
jgi:hypothetical protein